MGFGVRDVTDYFHTMRCRRKALVYDILPLKTTVSMGFGVRDVTDYFHTMRCRRKALVYDILPLEEGAGKRCSECECADVPQDRELFSR